MTTETMYMWTVVAIDFEEGNTFIVLYEGNDYEEMLGALTDATYEHDHVRVEYHG